MTKYWSFSLNGFWSLKKYREKHIFYCNLLFEPYYCREQIFENPVTKVRRSYYIARLWRIEPRMTTWMSDAYVNNLFAVILDHSVSRSVYWKWYNYKQVIMCCITNCRLVFNEKTFFFHRTHYEAFLLYQLKLFHILL